jgi:hypothetical protein
MNTETKQDYPYTINGRAATTTHRTPTQAQVLTDAGFEPADDFILIQRTPHGTRVVSTDDVLELGSGSAEFFAFESGASYELTLNEHSIWWGAEKIEIKEIRALGNVPDEDELIWEREDGSSEVLPTQGKFGLRSKGVEHLKTRKRPPKPTVYHYFVDIVEYTTDHESLTGAQITAKVPGWNPANSLVLEGQGSEQDEVIRPTTTVVFKGRETPAHFIIVPPATFGCG